MKACGVVTDLHFLDHLVPLCSLFQAPILCLNKEIAQIGELFYPESTFLSIESEEQLDAYLEAIDLLIYVHFHRIFPFGFQFLDYLYNKKKRSLFSFHGQPDKFSSIFWVERIVDEDLVLIYGKKLKKLLEEKKIAHRINTLFSGNYRLAYYEKHRHFFQKKISSYLFEKSNKTTILFAPTWSQENRVMQLNLYSSPLEKSCSFLLDKLPDNVELYIKLHPHFLDNKNFLSHLEKKIHDHPNIKLLPNIPLIYPLLEHVAIFVGDYSSIGYDFLYFDRPLFFLPDKIRTDLHSCGRVLEEKEWPDCHKIFEENSASFSEIRKKTYEYVFGPKKSLALLKKEIENAYD